MILRLLCVGGVKGPLASAVEEYEERARRYWRFKVTEVPAGMGKARKVEPTVVLATEEARILDQLSAGSWVVALTREGKSLGSRALARTIQQKALHSVPEVCFVIGGAFGLGPEVLRRAEQRLSLSPLTLPHEVARLVLAEQLYRAGTISRNEPYHKGP